MPNDQEKKTLNSSQKKVKIGNGKQILSQNIYNFRVLVLSPSFTSPKMHLEIISILRSVRIFPCFTLFSLLTFSLNF